MTYRASALSGNYRSILESARQADTLRSETGRELLILLSPEMRRQLVDELYNALQIAQSEGALKSIHEIIEDWIMTAQVWSNEELRDEVLEFDVNPPADVLI